MSGVILNDGIQKYNLYDLLGYCGFDPEQIEYFLNFLKYAQIDLENLLEPQLQVLDIANGLKHLANTLLKKYIQNELNEKVVNQFLIDVGMPYNPYLPNTSGILGLVKHIDQRTEYLWADLMSSRAKIHLGI